MLQFIGRATRPLGLESDVSMDQGADGSYHTMSWFVKSRINDPCFLCTLDELYPRVSGVY
jgi:hypothetical protein